MSNNYKDASERIAGEMRELSFNAMVDYVAKLQAQVGELEYELAEAELRIDQLDTEPQVVGLRAQLAAMETIADMWVDMANDLYEGLMVAQEQLSKHGIGLRPLAQTAMLRFLELTEEWDDDGDD